MIETLQIENFRSFASVHLTGLKRINLVVGDNGVGKTAFLEGLFFASGPSPEIGLRLRQWRGLETGGGVPHADMYEALWADLFRNYDRRNKISIELYGTRNDSRSLSVYYNPGATITLPLTEQESSGTAYTPVTFHWKAPGVSDTIVTPQGTPGGLQIPVYRESNIRSAFIPAHYALSGQTTANLYSNLSKEKKEERIVEALREQFPDIQSVSVEIESGAHLLFISVPWISRKIPLADFSNGAQNVAGILLYVTYSARGVVFIDELENGLHHTRYGQLWSQIYRFADEFETQVFASTHSAECLRGALPLLEKDPESFSLIQIYQRDGHSEAAVVKGPDMWAAIAHGIEVRA